MIEVDGKFCLNIDFNEISYYFWILLIYFDSFTPYILHHFAMIMFFAFIV